MWCCSSHLIGLDHVRPGPGEAGVGWVGVAEVLLAAAVLQLPLLLRLLDHGVPVLGPGGAQPGVPRPRRAEVHHAVGLLHGLDQPATPTQGSLGHNTS